MWLLTSPHTRFTKNACSQDVWLLTSPHTRFTKNACSQDVWLLTSPHTRFNKNAFSQEVRLLTSPHTRFTKNAFCQEVRLLSSPHLIQDLPKTPSVKKCYCWPHLIQNSRGLPKKDLQQCACSQPTMCTMDHIISYHTPCYLHLNYCRLSFSCSLVGNVHNASYSLWPPSYLMQTSFQFFAGRKCAQYIVLPVTSILPNADILSVYCWS